MKRNPKAVLILFAVGLICLIYGLARLYVEFHFDLVGLLILGLGLISIFVCFGQIQQNAAKRILSSWLRPYGPWIIVFVIFAAILIGINYMTLKTELRFDLTRNRQHTLSQYTTEVLHNLNDNVQATAFYVGLPEKYLEDLLAEYARVSQGKIKTAIVDPLVDIGYAAQFGNVISGKEKKVIAQSSSGRKDIDFTDTMLTEEQLTNALLQVTRQKRVVYFLSGHGEYDISSGEDNGLKTFTELLAKNNIESRRLALGLGVEVSKAVPDDCDVLVVAGAKENLTAKEQETVQKYLESGGDAMFLIEHTLITTPDKTLTEEELRKNPSFNEIFSSWGIRIADDIVLDLASHASGDVGSPATRNYPAHKAIVSGLDYTFYIRPRSISILGKRNPAIHLAPLVLTQSEKESWGETNRNLLVKYDELDRPGPIPIAFVIWKPKENSDVSAPNVSISDTRMAVFTDADFLSNAFIKQYSNAQMGLNVINWVSELDYHMFIDRKDINIERLNLTSRQKRIIMVILWVLPMLIAGSGIFVWLNQKVEY